MARVLVIDDDEGVRRALRRLLERAGHEVALAADGEEALAEVAVAEPFDVALVDLNLPGMSGYDFLRRATLVDRFGRVAVVVTSGSADLVPADLAGAVALVLDKPVDLARLLLAIDDYTRPTLPPDAAPSSGA
jgi:CheY-like chemotaxis protein